MSNILNHIGGPFTCPFSWPIVTNFTKYMGSWLSIKMGNIPAHSSRSFTCTYYMGRLPTHVVGLFTCLFSVPLTYHSSKWMGSLVKYLYGQYTYTYWWAIYLPIIIEVLIN